MAWEQKDFEGSLFKNSKRENDRQPNLSGSAKINGVEYWVSGWTKGEGEKKWISLAFKAKTETAKKKADDDVPF